MCAPENRVPWANASHASRRKVSVGFFPLYFNLLEVFSYPASATFPIPSFCSGRKLQPDCRMVGYTICHRMGAGGVYFSIRLLSAEFLILSSYITGVGIHHHGDDDYGDTFLSFPFSVECTLHSVEFCLQYLPYCHGCYIATPTRWRVSHKAKHIKGSKRIFVRAEFWECGIIGL